MGENKMNLSTPLYLQIPELRNLEKNKGVLQEQDNFLEYLGNAEKFPGLILSLRYLFDIKAEPKEKLKIYLGINHVRGNRHIIEEVESLLIRGRLRDYYQFKRLPTPPILLHELTWVKEICEVIKYEEFDREQDFYVPYIFQANPQNDMCSVCKVLNRVGSKMAIEVTLQTCDESEKKEISDVLTVVLREINPPNYGYYFLQTNRVRNTVGDNYNEYNKAYLQNNRNLFKYNIKILAENGYDISPVVSVLAQNALKNGKYGIKYREIRLKQGDANFDQSLGASERVQLSRAAKWEGWETKIAQKQIPDLSSASYEVSFPIMIEETEYINNDLPENNRAITKMADLQPLARLVTPTEISGFFRIVVAGEKGIPGIKEEKPRLKIVKDEDLFRKYRDQITEDQYIVGMTDDGVPVYSSWAEIPHRLIAGRTGYGKSNFLKWIIFQFLYVNPKRKIYIADFKGIDFQYLKKIKANIEIATNADECAKMAEGIYEGEYKRRRNLMDRYKVDNFQKLRQHMPPSETDSVYRILWIIDEARAIQDASRDLKKTIESRLELYATQGRSFGIHLIYCTQLPSSDVISPQVKENCGEKVVFRLSSSGTNRTSDQVIIDNEIATQIISLPKGKAVLEVDDEIKYVKTPLINPNKVPLEKSIWRYVRI